MPPRLAVYAEVLPAWLSRAMYRINQFLRSTAPHGVSFVSEPELADIQVLDVIGVGSLDFIRVPRYVLLQQCYLTTERPEAAFWLPIFKSALMVMSYHDLHALTGDSRFHFYRAPWGVDRNVFHDMRLVRKFAVLTSGYDANQEPIHECRRAVFELLGGRRGGMLHLGPPIGDSRVDTRLGISDNELRTCYNQARYVSGMRRGEGFELPVVEGLACGARPICFDQPNSRFWFGEHALFVPEVASEQLSRELASVLLLDPAPVLKEEREAVLERFSWDAIFKEFWAKVLGAA